MTAHETLGVEPNASKDKVKRAYRNKAKTMHPDAGGDKREFERLQVAYKKMMGENTQPSQAVNIVIGMYNELLLANQENMLYINIEMEIAHRLQNNIGAMYQNIGGARNRIEILEKINANCKENSIIKAFNDNQIAEGQRFIQQTEHQIKEHTEAIEIARNLGYKPQQKPQTTFYTNGMYQAFNRG